jgi:lysophospholipase L1-like esterase
MTQQFLFIGDSLIEFFNWQERFPDKKVFNYGIAGETAEGLLARLPGIIARVQSPDLIMIMTGINNVAMEDYGFLFTYEKIISRVQETYGQVTIAMASLLPINLSFLGDAVPRVNKRLKEVSQNYNIIFLDLYPLFLDDNLRIITSCFETDGVHLSDKGYEVWANALENTIFPLLD